jgi:hypothetical protein
MIKTKFGERLRSKTETAQTNEMLLKVICHNVCCLIRSMHELGLEPTFWANDAPAPRVPDYGDFLGNALQDVPIYFAEAKASRGRAGSGVWGGREVSQGEEGLPEASFGFAVTESWDKSGQTESRGTLRPDEPRARFGLGESVSGERVVERVDLVDRPGADRHEGVGFGGEDFLCEQARGGVGYVGFRKSHGLQAPVQGLQDSRSDRLLDDQHNPGGGIAERSRVAGLLHAPGYAGDLVYDLGPVVARRVSGRTFPVSLTRGSHDGCGGYAGRWL